MVLGINLLVSLLNPDLTIVDTKLSEYKLASSSKYLSDKSRTSASEAGHMIFSLTLTNSGLPLEI